MTLQLNHQSSIAREADGNAATSYDVTTTYHLLWSHATTRDGASSATLERQGTYSNTAFAITLDRYQSSGNETYSSEHSWSQAQHSTGQQTSTLGSVANSNQHGNTSNNENGTATSLWTVYRFDHADSQTEGSTSWSSFSEGSFIDGQYSLSSYSYTVEGEASATHTGYGNYDGNSTFTSSGILNYSDSILTENGN